MPSEVAAVLCCRSSRTCCCGICDNIYVGAYENEASRVRDFKCLMLDYKHIVASLQQCGVTAVSGKELLAGCAVQHDEAGKYSECVSAG